MFIICFNFYLLIVITILHEGKAQNETTETTSSLNKDTYDEKWPEEITQLRPAQFYDCLYNYYFCTDHYGAWPDNKDACYNEYRACESAVSVTNVIKGTIKDLPKGIFANQESEYVVTHSENKGDIKNNEPLKPSNDSKENESKGTNNVDNFDGQGSKGEESGNSIKDDPKKDNGSIGDSNNAISSTPNPEEEDSESNKDTEEEFGSNKDTEEESGSNKDTEEESGSNKDTEEESGSNKDTEEESGSNKDTEEEFGSNKDTEEESGSNKDTEESESNKDTEEESNKDIEEESESNKDTEKEEDSESNIEDESNLGNESTDLFNGDGSITDLSNENDSLDEGQTSDSNKDESSLDSNKADNESGPNTSTLSPEQGNGEVTNTNTGLGEDNENSTNFEADKSDSDGEKDTDLESNKESSSTTDNSESDASKNDLNTDVEEINNTDSDGSNEGEINIPFNGGEILTDGNEKPPKEGDEDGNEKPPKEGDEDGNEKPPKEGNEDENEKPPKEGNEDENINESSTFTTTQNNPSQNEPSSSTTESSQTASITSTSTEKNSNTEKEGEELTPSTTQAPPLTGPKSCSAIIKQNDTSPSGIYTLVLDGKEKKVFCEMKNGDGWTLLQRRGEFDNEENYFYRNWKEYSEGFGELNDEHWVGLETMFELTNQDKKVDLRFILEDYEGNRTAVTLVEFRVANEESGYRLFYKGIINHSRSKYPLLGRSVPAKGTKFSALDKDNDEWKGNCAVRFSGGWWYSACHNSNINGLNLRGPHKSFGNGINWYHFRGYHYSLKATEMKIKPSTPRGQKKKNKS